MRERLRARLAEEKSGRELAEALLDELIRLAHSGKKVPPNVRATVLIYLFNQDSGTPHQSVEISGDQGEALEDAFGRLTAALEAAQAEDGADAPRES